MKKSVAAWIISIALLLDNARASAASWISAFDNTDRLPSGLIDQRIPPEIMSLPILGLRFYQVAGAGSYVELAPHLGFGSTLQNHFNQPWIFTGFESDNYKLLSVNTGSKLTTIYIADDHDIVNPAGGPFIRQTNYAGTPAGLITSGYNTFNYWLDHGSPVYRPDEFDKPHVYRLDILAVLPETNGPTLRIVRSEANPTAVLFWQTNAAGFTLQSTTNLSHPVVWASNLPAPVMVGGQYRVTESFSARQKFYRLHKP